MIMHRCPHPCTVPVVNFGARRRAKIQPYPAFGVYLATFVARSEPAMEAGTSGTWIGLSSWICSGTLALNLLSGVSFLPSIATVYSAPQAILLALFSVHPSRGLEQGR